ncbi:class I SAM-dependent methyltransferase [Mycolicibacterium sp. 120270]|uniref:class I SAM-dependent methyltransferase n=1 Tax=Mycolicibacterium sp. 120270 TaxID=3090600 RepID=UPI00299EC7B5|nr:class I SAM-dependent methyltransferase [Mycolicibacterium sp. 120270]MDX1882293.1 class I SAM-dependent methyltransferase [Mycolicibacterium sp. 120270]
MLDRLKKSAREKMQRAVSEVVAAENARIGQEQQDRHAELMAALERIDGSVKAVVTRLADTEYRARRDISYAQDTQAAQQSAAFVLENMPTAKVFWESPDTLRYALSEIKGPGLALEFGVATGSTLRLIADAVAADRTVAGFDVFTGLPETWRTGFPAGEFAQEPPDVPGATVIAGLFEDTLPAFLAETDEPIAFMHIDCDLYSSTKTVFDHTADRLAPDTVLVFDEFFNYPGWQQHEYRAWTEFVERSGRSFEYLAYTGNHEQVVVRLH